MPLEDPLDALEVRDPDADTLLGFLGVMEFRALSGRVAATLGTEAPVIAPKAVAEQGPATLAARGPVALPPIDPTRTLILRDAAALAAWTDVIRERGAVALAIETDVADEMRGEPVGIGMATGPGELAYLPLGHVTGSGGLFGERAEGQPTLAEAMALLRPVLEDPAVMKIGQNVKGAVKLAERHGIAIGAGRRPDADVLRAALGAARARPRLSLADSYLNHTPGTIKALTGTGKAALSFAQVGIEEAGRCVAEDAEVAWRLHWTLKPRLPFARVTRVYETMERPLVPVLAEMERHGVRVDRQALSRLSGDFAQRMAGLEEEAYRLAGGRFNIGSPKQLGEILFDQMGLGGGRKGKTGAYSTGADMLEELAAQGHELPARCSTGACSRS